MTVEFSNFLPEWHVPPYMLFRGIDHEAFKDSGITLTNTSSFKKKKTVKLDGFTVMQRYSLQREVVLPARVRPISKFAKHLRVHVSTRQASDLP